MSLKLLRVVEGNLNNFNLLMCPKSHQGLINQHWHLIPERYSFSDLENLENFEIRQTKL